MSMRGLQFTCEEMSNASPEELFETLSNWERVTEFWKGTREIKKMDDGTFWVHFAFPGTAKMKIMLDKPGLSVTEEYMTGPFKGTKKTTITTEGDKAKMTTVWDVSLSAMLMFGKNKIKGHFDDGTHNALRRISDACTGETTVEEAPKQEA